MLWPSCVIVNNNNVSLHSCVHHTFQRAPSPPGRGSPWKVESTSLFWEGTIDRVRVLLVYRRMFDCLLSEYLAPRHYDGTGARFVSNLRDTENKKRSEDPGQGFENRQAENIVSQYFLLMQWCSQPNHTVGLCWGWTVHGWADSCALLWEVAWNRLMVFLPSLVNVKLTVYYAVFML